MRDYLPLLLVIALLPLSAWAGIYKYIDANGRVAYSDRPVEGAQAMKLRSAPTPPADKYADEDGVTDDNISGDGEVTRYSSLQVLNPTPGKTINDRSGSVQVILLPTPPLSSSHQLIINVDGKDISRGRHANLSLTNVGRGSHSVTGRIVDADGFVMIESPTVSFHVRKSGAES